MRALALVLVASACSIPEKHADNGAVDAAPGTPDAPSFDGAPDAMPPKGDFTCNGKALPNPNGSVKITGAVGDLSTGSTLPNVTINGYLAGNASPAMTVTTDSQGKFTATIPTGAPLDAYIKATLPNYADSYAYPATPIYRDTSFVIYMIPAAKLSTFGDPAKVNVVLQVADCAGQPLAGATLATQPSGDPIQYYNTSNPNVGGKATDSSGTAFDSGIAPGSITLTGEDGPFALRPVTFPGAANTITNVWIQP
jgi:hypothetical protein